MQQSESVEGTRILASLMYGNIEIYAAVGRKPQITDHDFRTESIQDVLMVCNTVCRYADLILLHTISHTASHPRLEGDYLYLSSSCTDCLSIYTHLLLSCVQYLSAPSYGH